MSEFAVGNANANPCLAAGAHATSGKYQLVVSDMSKLDTSKTYMFALHPHVSRVANHGSAKRLRLDQSRLRFLQGVFVDGVFYSVVRSR